MMRGHGTNSMFHPCRLNQPMLFGHIYVLQLLCCACLFSVYQPVLGIEPPNRELIKTEPHRMDLPHIPNALRVNEKVISGGQPDGDVAFQELQKLGVKTVISVDGAKPNVELARKYQMRYVHLPHSYQGIPESRIAQLAKAVRDLDGPIFIHCHHGKHRSPTAAAVACVAASLLPPEQAVSILKLAGTGDAYQGLFDVAKRVRPLSNLQLAAMKADFPEIAQLPKTAESMVALEHTFDQIKKYADNGWRLNRDEIHDSSHQSLLLAEHFAELVRLEKNGNRPAQYEQMLVDSQRDSMSMHVALKQWAQTSAKADFPHFIEPIFARIGKNCTACHHQYRDNAPTTRK